MQDLFNFCAFTDNALIVGLMMAIVVLLAIIMVLDVKARRAEIDNDLLDINIEPKEDYNSEVTEIKYVPEDAELEKTQAKIELENLKQELMKEEAAKQVIQQEPVNVVNEEVHTEEVAPALEPIKNDVFEIKEEVPVELEDIDEQVDRFEDEQESSAIISVEELQKRASELHDSEEVMKHEDEGNEPISLEELEALYKKAEVVEVKEEPLKEVTMPTEFKLDNSFNQNHFTSSPIISPVYGIDDGPRDNSLDNINLEQTANLDKLNEELKKVNEFLAVLKDLRSKL